MEIIDWTEGDTHVEYVVKVRGRTKYLVNLRDLAENGLISGELITENAGEQEQ